MRLRTVDWAALRLPAVGCGEAEGLRERKKRLMRQQLSDTATEMFVERGFDAVRVAEIADVCGVSEKTVYNYFPTKESLLLDRWESTMASLRTGLADPDVPPIEAALRILDDELCAMTSWLGRHADPADAAAKIRRFRTLIETTPSLRAHQSDMTAQLIAVAAEVLAQRFGLSAADPEAQIAATALLGLWHIQLRGLAQYTAGAATPATVQESVTADVRRAARLIEAGLGSLGASAGPAAR